MPRLVARIFGARRTISGTLFLVAMILPALIQGGSRDEGGQSDRATALEALPLTPEEWGRLVVSGWQARTLRHRYSSTREPDEPNFSSPVPRMTKTTTSSPAYPASRP